MIIAYEICITLLCLILAISYLRKAVITKSENEDSRSRDSLTAVWLIFSFVGFLSIFQDYFNSDNLFAYVVKSMQAATTILFVYIVFQNKIASDYYNNKKRTHILYSISHSIFLAVLVITLSLGFFTIHGHPATPNNNSLSTKIWEGDIFYTGVYFIGSLLAFILLPEYDRNNKIRFFLKLAALLWLISTIPEFIMAIINNVNPIFSWIDNILFMGTYALCATAILKARSLERKELGFVDMPIKERISNFFKKILSKL